jgi:hypothetical protein
MLSGLINPTPTEHMAQALLERLIELRRDGWVGLDIDEGRD